MSLFSAIEGVFVLHGGTPTFYFIYWIY